MIVADRVQAYLISLGIGRDPRVAGAAPPIFRQPVDGTPAPGEGIGVENGPTAVIGILQTLEVPSPRFEEQWRRVIVDIQYRTLKWPDATALYWQARNALIGKTNWTMSGLKVIESLEWRGHQLIQSDSGQGFTSMSSVLFQVYEVNMT